MADEDNPLKFFTARQAAEIAKAANIAYVPHSKKGMLDWLSTLDARTLDCLSRPREGRGGGKVYHWTIFPERLWSALDAEVERRMPPPDDVFHSRWLPNPGKPDNQRAIIQRTRPPAFWGGAPKERRQRPTFNPPSSILAQGLAAAAGLDTTPAFLPFEVRSVDRCLVRFDRKRFFSRDLNPHHKQEVCVTAAPTHPDLLWVLVYEKPRNCPAGPGKLICVADTNAGKRPYVPLEYQQAAEAKRAEGHARRRARKALEHKEALEMEISVSQDEEHFVSNAQVGKRLT